MTKEHWEANIPEFSNMVSDIFAAHDISCEISTGRGRLSLYEIKNVWKDHKYEICITLSEDEKLWVNFYYYTDRISDFGGLFNKYVPGGINEVSIFCAHMVNGKFKGILDMEHLRNYRCQYCTVRNNE